MASSFTDMTNCASGAVHNNSGIEYTELSRKFEYLRCENMQLERKLVDDRISALETQVNVLRKQVEQLSRKISGAM